MIGQNKPKQEFVFDPKLKQFWPLLTAMAREGIISYTDAYNIARDIEAVPRRKPTDLEPEDNFPWDSL